MSDIEYNNETSTKDLKLYSIRAIIIATILGTPLASGYLMGENFKALGLPKKARFSVIIGILGTIFIFVGLFLIPEKLLDQLPNVVVPAIYTGIVIGVLLSTQGDILKAHQKNDYPFSSIWRAVGMGIISLLIVVSILLGADYLIQNTPINKAYTSYMDDFTKNEEESLVFYEQLNSQPAHILIQELEYKIIPIWKENIDIIHDVNDIDNLQTSLRKQNNILLKYAELRLEAFELIQKAISEDTNQYNQQLDQIHLDIDKELEKLN